MKCLVTGSTGFIGNRLTDKLVSLGHEVHVLVRSLEKAKIYQSKNIRIFKGDITDPESVRKSMVGCTHVFHLAALAQPISANPDDFMRINVDGTRNVLEAALVHQVKKVVVTSSAGILSPSDADTEVDETTAKPFSHLTDYARTKELAGQLCMEYINRGLSVVIVLPSRVYGPGILNESNAVTKIINLFRKGKWHLIPGNGESWGNYVFIDDVVNGHIAAMEKGISGEMYILGGENMTFKQLFGILCEITGRKPLLVKIPASLLIWIARCLVFLSGITGKKALITPEWITRYLLHTRISSAKANRDLDYCVTPFRDGTRKTLEWLN